MRKSNFYVILAALGLILVLAGYYVFYLEYQPVEYKNGTLVEAIPDSWKEEWKMAA